MEQSASGEDDSSSAGQKFDHLNNKWWTVQTVNLLTNQHLPLVLPVCPLPEAICTYHVHCATGSTLLLAMSIQSLDHPADCTEVSRSVLSIIFEGIDWFESSMMWVGDGGITKFNLFIMYRQCILVSLKSDKIKWFIPWKTYTFTKMSPWFRLIMRNFSDQVAEDLKTQTLCSFLQRKSCGLWDNVGKYGTAWQDRDGNIIRRMRCACWINKARM